MSYITIKELIERTGWKYSTIIAWANKCIIPSRKLTNGKKSKYLFVWAEIEKKIEGLKVNNL